MLIHEISKSKGINKPAKRLGRGNSSGKGNTSTKGTKGQKARSGVKLSPWFEGGQTPLTQRLPKLKGFKRYFKLIQEYQIVNIGNLEKDDRIQSSAVVDKELLKKYGYIKKLDLPVKILGNGDISKKLSFVGIEKFSQSAKSKIEDIGGTIN